MGLQYRWAWARRSALALCVVLVLAAGPAQGVGADEGSDNPNGFLIAWDPNNGNKRWRNVSDSVGIRRVVAEAKNLVYAYETTCIRGGGIGEPAAFIAFDRDTGRERWRVPAGFGMGVSSQFSVGGDTVVLVGRNGNLHGLDPTTGRNRWERPLDGSVPVAGTDDLVLLAEGHLTSGALQAIDRRTGDPRWTYTNPLAGSLDVFQVVVVDGATAVIKYSAPGPGGGAVGGQIGVDLATGHQLWEQPRDHELKVGPGWGLMFSVTPNTFAPPYGPLTALDPKTKEQRWVVPLEANDVAAVVDGVVLALTLTSIEQVALDARTGRRKWDSAAWSFQAARGSLIISTTQGGSHLRARVTARHVRTGTARWKKRAPLGGGKSWYVGKNVYVAGGCVGVDET